MFEYLKNIGRCPEGYRCSCGQEGTRLFRKPGHDAIHPLICVPCMEKGTGMVVMTETVQFEELAIAIPTMGGGWFNPEYPPDDGLLWWFSLPMRPVGVGAPSVPWIKVPIYDGETDRGPECLPPYEYIPVPNILRNDLRYSMPEWPAYTVISPVGMPEVKTTLRKPQILRLIGEARRQPQTSTRASHTKV